MIDCVFELNGEPMSRLKCGASSFAAFSGFGSRTNRREFACRAGIGPIPPGVYYILDRQSGGLLGPLRDMFNDRRHWFALYANDGKVDDHTYCNMVRRGNFRLHPKGPLGISEGCITIETQAEFQRLRPMLRSSAQVAIPGTDLKAYGRIFVK